MTKHMRPVLGVVAIGVLTLSLVAGCSSSSSTPSPATGGTGSTHVAADAPTTTVNGQEAWADYPDVPFVPIMTEVDGHEIPRFETVEENMELAGSVPANVGNTYAKQHPGKPTTGDWLIIRFNSEPKSLNPIVESSAVQGYISSYVQEALAWQNLETFEYEPHLAKKWVIEDSVKLSADFPGKERRIAIDGGESAAEVEAEYPAKPEGDKNDPVIKFTTTTVDGQPIGRVWVGLFPAEDIVGAPTTGYHYWSDAQGKLEISGIVPGRYQVRVGAEVFGTTTEDEDGSLVVTPETSDNPLHEELKSSGEKSLTLAKGSWTDIQPSTIYTFFLRDDVKWSDGTAYTTKDLEFAYAVVNNPFVDGESLRVYYQDLIECKALDPLTVRMRYRQQYFLSFEFTAGLSAYGPPWHQFEKYFRDDGLTLSMERLTPAQETAQKKVSVYGQQFGKFYNTDPRYNNRPLGTGPYIVDQWERANRVELRRNDSYWGKEHPGHLDRLIFKFIPDGVTALQALRSGEIDFCWSLSPEQYFEDLAGPPGWFKDKYVKASWYSPGFGYVGWNLLKPMFQDRRVRIALSLLFNRQEFIKEKLHDEAVLVSGSQYFFGPGYDHEVKPIGYDPVLAADLLADAGWVDTDNDGILDKDGKKFEFTFLMPPGSSTSEERAALIQRNLKDVGIKMEIRTLEWASFLDKILSRDFDVVNLAWATPLEGDPYQIWHSSGSGPDKRGSNHVSFANPLADQLIEMVRVTLDPEKRKRIFYSFHRLLDREQPYLFLYTSKDFGAYHHRFQGVKWYRLRPGFDLREWYVPKDQQIH